MLRRREDEDEVPHERQVDEVHGLALNLDEREIGCVILGDATHIEEGQEVRRTGEILSVPVGDAFLGRVVDPLGKPLDGKGEIKTDATRPAEFKAPGVVQRQPVKEPMQTGQIGRAHV